MSTVTTHVLDSTLGCPAVGVPVRLDYLGGAGPVPGGAPLAPGGASPAGVASPVAAAVTGGDGRVNQLGPAHLQAGIYRLVFDTGAYFAASGTRTFYPEVAVSFVIDNTDGHYHVPLLLSPFAYATYRGS